jgi:hypothetical protein
MKWQAVVVVGFDILEVSHDFSACIQGRQTIRNAESIFP